MPDLFDNVILCRQCGKEMQKETIVKNGVSLRSAHCEKCHKREFHPLDLEKFREFQELKQRPFRVKLRMVGNSYAVSIPREIIDFFEDADRMFEEVEMQFSEFDKLMLSFHQHKTIIHSKIPPKETRGKEAHEQSSARRSELLGQGPASRSDASRTPSEKNEKVFKNSKELNSKENSRDSRESKGKNGKSD